MKWYESCICCHCDNKLDKPIVKYDICPLCGIDPRWTVNEKKYFDEHGHLPYDITAFCVRPPNPWQTVNHGMGPHKYPVDNQSVIGYLNAG